MRQLRTFTSLARSIAVSTAVSLAVILAAQNAHAAIKINSVDSSRVSAVEGLGTATVTIYGGTAGDDCSGTDATSTTCSSCKYAGVSSGNGDAGLLPCNDNRINPNLIVSITVTSDSLATGYPVIAVAPASGTVTVLAQSNTPTAVSKGNSATINIPWSTLCNNMLTVATTSGSTTTTGGSSPGVSCSLSSATSDAAQATFYVGFSASANPSTLTSGTDDYTPITIALRSGDLNGSSGSLASSTGSGLTHFEFYSGDSKGTIHDLTGVTGFPNYENTAFRYVRVLFEKRASANTPVWSKINRGSPHTDLAISTATTDTSNINLSPIIVTSGTGYDSSGKQISLDITNDNVYDTKVAVVDAARNVEFYTAAANDNDCDGGAAAVGGSGLQECHTIRASAVVGVLANKVNCFVATASYGSPMAKEVDTFRSFRDTYLIPTKLGLKFVRWYYNEGPKYAHFIRQSDTYRAIARGLLWLPLQFAKVSLAYGIWVGLFFLAFALSAPIGALILATQMYRRWIGKRSNSVHA